MIPYTKANCPLLPFSEHCTGLRGLFLALLAPTVSLLQLMVGEAWEEGLESRMIAAVQRRLLSPWLADEGWWSVEVAQRARRAGEPQ
jgi:hypothetical protein